MSPTEVLRLAADRVQFQGWTQGTYAIDAEGHNVGSSSPKAVQWCAKGALKAESPQGFGRAARCLELHLGTMNTVWGTDLRIWNDTPGHLASGAADTMRRVAKELENGVQ